VRLPFQWLIILPKKRKTYTIMKSTKLLLIVLLCNIARQTFAQSQKDRIRQVENNLIPFVPVEGFKTWNIEERMKYHKIQGVSIAVIKDFKVDWAKSYGWADTARKIPMTTETMLSAGSISKLLMATGALKLVEEGKLELDKPINNYLTSWKLGENDFTKKTPVTLRMLLSHTGGTSQSAYFGFDPSIKKLPTIVEILDGKSPDGTRRVGVNKEPNTGFQYSGGGSLIAQLAMMDVSNTDFEPLMRALVFNPLGMNNATFEQPLSDKYALKASWGYQNATWFKGTPYVYPQLAAAGLYTTPTDLAKLIIDIQKSYHGKGKILSQYSAREMMKPQAIFEEGNNSKEQIAVGPFLYQQPKNKEEKGIYFYFDGANAGFIATVMGNLTEGYGVVIMVNSGNDYNGLCKEIKRSVAKVYDWYNFLPEPIKPLLLDQKTLESYTGRYKNNDNEVLNVRKEGNYLVLNYNNNPDIYTFPIKKDTVVFTDYNFKGWFVRNEKGEVIGLQNQYQNAPILRMKEGEYITSELLKMHRFEEAKAQLRKVQINEYQITYMAYDNAKDPEAAKAILEVASEKFPKSSIVFARWGDYYSLKNDKANALLNYENALKLEPSDKDLMEKIRGLR
jgi:CubicO group peptidase (beta-lactamase class C family)